MSGMVATSIDLPVRRLVALVDAVRMKGDNTTSLVQDLVVGTKVIRRLTQAGENELAQQEAMRLHGRVESSGVALSPYKEALLRRTLNVIKACR